MKIIQEINEEIKVTIEESANSPEKQYFIEGVFLQGNIKNRNGRVYPMEILDAEVSRYKEMYIDKGRAFGELGHPTTGPNINLERVSHMIKSLEKDGDNYIGKAKIIDTPYGKIVKSLIDEGAKLGVSSRGIGTLFERGGINFVNKDFQLATAADIVADPSAPDAFVKGILENTEWIYENGMWTQVDTEKAQKIIKKTNSKEYSEKALKLFENYLRRL